MFTLSFIKFVNEVPIVPIQYNSYRVHVPYSNSHALPSLVKDKGGLLPHLYLPLYKVSRSRTTVATFSSKISKSETNKRALVSFKHNQCRSLQQPLYSPKFGFLT
uniref:Uncharacterized protein n=1 Tax=Cacopsylla melanoneura TaxID=428564 RepID=A0A8D8TET9_9HEMI